MFVNLQTPNIKIQADRFCTRHRSLIKVLFWGAVWCFSGSLVGYFGLNGVMSGRGATWWNGPQDLMPGSLEAMIIALVFLLCGVAAAISGIGWGGWNLFVKEECSLLNGQLQIRRTAAGISFCKGIAITDQTLLDVIQWRGGTGVGLRFGDPTSHFRGDYLLAISNGENTLHVGLGMSDTDARQVLGWLSDMRNSRKSSGGIGQK